MPAPPVRRSGRDISDFLCCGGLSVQPPQLNGLYQATFTCVLGILRMSSRSSTADGVRRSYSPARLSARGQRFGDSARRRVPEMSPPLDRVLRLAIAFIIAGRLVAVLRMVSVLPVGTQSVGPRHGRQELVVGDRNSCRGRTGATIHRGDDLQASAMAPILIAHPTCLERSQRQQPPRATTTRTAAACGSERQYPFGLAVQRIRREPVSPAPATWWRATGRTRARGKPPLRPAVGSRRREFGLAGGRTRVAFRR